MGVHSEEERNEQVMCVPESLKRLLTDLCVSSRVHEKHAQEHDMPRDATSFGVVDLNGCNFSDLSLLDVEEADSISRISVNQEYRNLLDIMSTHVRNGPEK